MIHIARSALHAATALLIAATLSARPIPAPHIDIASESSLAMYAHTCGWLNRLTLTADIVVTKPLTIMCPVILDLAGHHLRTRGILVETSHALTIRDSAGGGEVDAFPTSPGRAGIDVEPGAALRISGGSVTAIGSGGGAGIGSRAGRGVGTILIEGGTIHAQGGQDGGAGIGGGSGHSGGRLTISAGFVDAVGLGRGAGIGGGRDGGTGAVTITGGTVHASGDDASAGIGGGVGAGGGTVRFSGGIVHATGGANACGIGGGFGGRRAAVTIGSHAWVSARGGHSAIGAGSVTDHPLSFGGLRVAGVLSFEGPLVIAGSSTGGAGAHIAIAATGQIRRATPTSEAAVSGNGRIVNDGILEVTDITGVTVTGHDPVRRD